MVNRILQETEEKMRTSVEVLKRELATIRTGHATPALIEHIKVDYVGVCNPYDLKETMKVIEEAYTTPGVSVVVSRATCAVLAERQMGGKAKARLPLYAIDKEKCLYYTKGKCLACVQELGCPAIMKMGDSLYIDPINCFGCGVCSQMCPAKAMHEVERSYENE